MPVLTVAVAPGPRRLADLAPAAGEVAVAAVRAAAEPLRGLRVVHLATPPFAPAALDSLRSTVPLLCDLGLDVRWLALAGDERADAAARAVGDALRGGEPGPPEDVEVWRERAAEAAGDVPRGSDVVVLHGAETLAAISGRDPASRRQARWVWQVEGDLSRPDAEVWGRLAEMAGGLDAVVVQRDDWAPPRVSAETWQPALDPLAPRHLDLPPRTAGGLARAAGLDLAHPFVVEVVDVDGSAFPELALDVLRAARDGGADGLQLAIVARLPAGDAGAWRTLGELTDHADGVEGVRVLADAGGTSAAEVNALQRLARVALSERAGLAAAEALWKGTPALSGAGGVDGLGEEIEDPAVRGARVAELVADPGLALELGRAGRERVREHHLITRLLADQLALFARITSPA